MLTTEHSISGLTAYPVFAPNQVLSHAHLNNAVSYLDAQTRLTRAALVGTGIVCGFEPSLDPEASEVTVSAGCGITTEGYLVVEDEQVLTHYRRAAISDDDFPVDTEEFASDVYELFASADPEDVLPEEGNPIKPFHEAQNDDGGPLSERLPHMTVLLLLDVEDEDRSDCIYDCDEAGVHRTLSVRPLVIEKEDAEKIIRGGYDPKGRFGASEDLDRIFNRHYYLPDLCLLRFGYTAQGKEERRIDLTGINSLESYVQAYADVSFLSSKVGFGKKISADDPIADVATAYRSVARVFSPFFAGWEPDSEADFKELEPTLRKLYELFSEKGAEDDPIDRVHGIQYFYDYLKDLITAYRELRREAFDLMDDCLPSPGRFPRHLMLGNLNGAEACPPSVYRTHFSQPPIYNGNKRRVERVRLLYERMRHLARHFRVPEGDGSTAVRITLSRSAQARLGDRAIPFYYDPTSSLYEYWSYERSRRCRPESNHSYFPLPADETHEPRSSDELFCAIDEYDFYRIEGHVGKEYTRAISEVKSLRERYNLPFDIIALKISVLEDSDEVEVDYLVEDLETVYAQCKHRLVCLLDRLIEEGDVGGDPETFRKRLTEEDGDFSTLARLSEEGRLDEYRESFERIFAKGNARNAACFSCTPEAVESLLEQYRERVQEFRERLLFHKFAEKHPGMEHLGGVPHGGTFILVYVNEGEQKALTEAQREAKKKADAIEEARLFEADLADEVKNTILRVQDKAREILSAREEGMATVTSKLEEAWTTLKDLAGGEQIAASLGNLIKRDISARTHTVVGDFCLPYVCCSRAPSFSLVVSQPRPIVLLEEFTYCEDDPGPYEFILHPEGGRLEGPGVEFMNGHYRFVPNREDVLDVKPDADGKRQITFVYFAEGGSDTFTVTVLPVPDASFSVEGLPESGVVCVDAEGTGEPMLLEPAVSGGTFEADGPGLEEENDRFFFNPSAVEPGTTVTITYNLPATDGACAGSAEQTVTVVEAPDATFSGLSESYCEDDDPATLAPDLTGPEVTSEFSGEGVRFDEETNAFVFDPRLVDVGEESREVAVTHTVTAGECTGTAEQTVTVFARPDASFRFATTLPDPLCVDPDEEPTDYLLVPADERGEFTTVVEGESGTRGLVETDAGTAFRPADVLSAEEVTITYQVEVGPGCAASTSRTVAVVEAPDADFTGLDDAYCEDDAPAVLTPATTDPDVTSMFEGLGIVFDQTNERYLFDPGSVEIEEESRQVTVTHFVTHESGCSNKLDRTVTVSRLPDAGFSFEPSIPSPLCIDPEADEVEMYRLSPAVAGGEFGTEIEGETGTTGLVVEGDQVWFDPSRVPPDVPVKIRHKVENEVGCTNSFSRTITTHHLPPADFEPIPEEVRVSDGPIALTPASETPPDGAFTATFGRFENTTQGIFKEEDQTFFDPAILLEFDVSLPETVIIAYTVRNEFGCRNRSEQEVLVRPREIIIEDDERSALLRERRGTYTATLLRLAEEDPEFAETKSFTVAGDFLDAYLSQTSPEAVKLYSETMGVVRPVFMRAESVRRSMYEMLIGVSTRALLDRLCAREPTQELFGAVSEQVDRLREGGVDTEAILERWQPEELTTVFPAENVEKWGSVLT